MEHKESKHLRVLTAGEGCPAGEEPAAAAGDASAKKRMATAATRALFWAAQLEAAARRLEAPADSGLDARERLELADFVTKATRTLWTLRCGYSEETGSRLTIVRLVAVGAERLTEDHMWGKTALLRVAELMLEKKTGLTGREWAILVALWLEDRRSATELAQEGHRLGKPLTKWPAICRAIELLGLEPVSPPVQREQWQRYGKSLPNLFKD